MLDQVGASVESRAPINTETVVARDVRPVEGYSEENHPKDRNVSESGIPLVAPFIVN